MFESLRVGQDVIVFFRDSHEDIGNRLDAEISGIGHEHLEFREIRGTDRRPQIITRVVPASAIMMVQHQETRR